MKRGYADLPLRMDWHSSGITTSVMNALKKVINRRSEELGVYVCGGRGKASLQTPAELLAYHPHPVKYRFVIQAIS
ncbi:DUF763 domain-containing protein [uncultured Parabacteroides sp.]|uniref:DUF763 domain-containing protein n=1 Tax=uncultured Parabacteroides sp. TaxID=512312 RepID=UPI0026142D0C|nr:DUF763 domain-containing protein [uncultured Parabacteroides sp.]